MDTKNVEAMAKEVKKQVVKEVSQAEKRASVELAKAKKSAEAMVKRAEQLVKKNPEKAALVAAGIGVALGAAAALLFTKSRKK